MDNHLSPAEAAKRFGISIKALRLYEQHGLLKPLRTANGSTGAVNFWPARTHWTQSWLFRNELWQRTVSVLPVLLP
jgi:hypothetical protein